MILETELSPAEVEDCEKLLVMHQRKAGFRKKCATGWLHLGYIEQRIGRLIPTAKGILYFARHRREHLRISHLIRNN